MTLDELVHMAWHVYDSANRADRPPMRAAVLAVLEAVERECVPEEALYRGGIPEFEGIVAGHNDCRAEMLRRIAEMRGLAKPAKGE